MAGPFGKSFESPYRILLQKEKIEQIIHGMDVPPSTVEIWPTWSCNYSCIWCIYKPQHEKIFLSFDHIRHMIHFCKTHHVSWIILSGGGEPTLHPRFTEILETLEENKQRYILETNGSTLSNFGRSIGKYCKFLRISLDAGTENSYSLVHNCSPAIFKKVLEAIGNLRIINPGLRIGLSFVLNPANQSTLIDFVEIANQLANEVLIRYDVTRSGNHLSTLEDDVLNKAKIPVVWRKPVLTNNKLASFCYGSALKLMIDPDGNIPFCCRSNEILGNINQQPLEDIWFTQKRLQLLASTNTKFCSPCRYTEVNEIIENFLIDGEFLDNL